MPAPYTPSATLSATDPPMPDGPATNAAVLRELLNGHAFTRAALGGVLRWAGRLSVDVGGSATVFAVRVEPIEAVAVTDTGGTWHVHSVASETVLGIGNVIGATSLPGDSVLYVYVGTTGSAPQVVITFNPPDATMTWESTTGTQRHYIGFVPTDPSGNPIPLLAVRGHYTFLKQVVAPVTDSKSAAGPYPLTLSVLPPHVRLAELSINLTGTGAWVRSIGDTGSVSTTPLSAYPMVLNTSQQIEWSPAGSTPSTVSADVRGCWE